VALDPCALVFIPPGSGVMGTRSQGHMDVFARTSFDLAELMLAETTWPQ